MQESPHYFFGESSFLFTREFGFLAGEAKLLRRYRSLVIKDHNPFKKDNEMRVKTTA